MSDLLVKNSDLRRMHRFDAVGPYIAKRVRSFIDKNLQPPRNLLITNDTDIAMTDHDISAVAFSSFSESVKELA